MSQHAEIAPSALSRIFQCPGSVKLTAGMPDESNSYANEGSLAHEVGALVLRNYEAHSDGVNGVFAEVRCGLHIFEYGTPDEKMLGFVHDYVTAMLAWKAMDENAIVEIEVKVRVNERIWGQCDFYCWLPSLGTLVIRDFKYGAGLFVPIEDNPQALSYTIGALKCLMESGAINEAGLAADQLLFDMGIYQPRNLGNEGQAERSQLLKFEDLQAFEAELYQLEKRVDLGTEFQTGVGCLFCKGTLKCPLLNGTMEALDQTVNQLGTKAPEMDNQTLAYWLNQWGAFKTFMASVNIEATNRAVLGELIPGYQLESPLGDRYWTDEGFVLTTLGDKPEHFAPRKLKSPAQMEKLGASYKTAIKTLTTRDETPHKLVKAG